jgi:hypothetical protein
MCRQYFTNQCYQRQRYNVWCVLCGGKRPVYYKRFTFKKELQKCIPTTPTEKNTLLPHKSNIPYILNHIIKEMLLSHRYSERAPYTNQSAADGDMLD